MDICIDNKIFLDDTEIEVGILVDNSWQECFLSIHYTNFDITHGGTYKNVLLLSADLAAHLGTGIAFDLLKKNNIPQSHPIYDLNHSDLWQRDA